MRNAIIFIFCIHLLISCTPKKVEPKTTSTGSEIQYQSLLEQFEENEREAMALFSLLENRPVDESIAFIDQRAVHLWDTNIIVLNEALLFAGEDAGKLSKAEFLKTYAVQRREMFFLIGKALKEDTDIYDARINELDSVISVEMMQRPH